MSNPFSTHQKSSDTRSLKCAVTRSWEIGAFTLSLILACLLLAACQDSTSKSAGVTSKVQVPKEDSSQSIAAKKPTKTMEQSKADIAGAEQLGGESGFYSAGEAQPQDSTASYGIGKEPSAEGSGNPVNELELEARLKLAAESVDRGKLEVVPPESPGEQGITQAELEVQLKATENIDSSTFEVVPSEDSKNPGITQKELETLMNAATDVDRSTLEVTPPEYSGGSGATQGEVDAYIKAAERMDSSTDEVAPAGNNSEPPITEAEVEALLEVSKGLDARFKEVVPPETAAK